MQLPEKDRYMEGRQKIIGMLMTLMGGRVEEELVFVDITSGASSDLKNATRIARLMVCNWGMSEEMGPQTFGATEELMFLGREISRSQDFSEDTARRIDAEVNRILREAHSKAKAILEKHRDKLEIIAKLLLERETMDGRDVDDIIKHGRILSETERSEMDAKANAGKPAVEAVAEVAAEPSPVVEAAKGV
jgi:cell division protease FtsH